MAADNLTKTNDSMFDRIYLRHRFLIGLIAALLAFLLIFSTRLNWLIITMIVWNTFAFFIIVTSWASFLTRSTEQIRLRAREEDSSKLVIVTIILVSCFASLVGVLVIILSGDKIKGDEIIYIPTAVLSILLSWVLVHTTFCFHYTHLYYGDDPNEPKQRAGGLEFPREKNPDFVDFAYFSFVIGMTFQVSDVQITSRLLRRLALFHGLLSFGLNTFVVALVINLIAGLKNCPAVTH